MGCSSNAVRTSKASAGPSSPVGEASKRAHEAIEESEPSRRLAEDASAGEARLRLAPKQKEGRRRSAESDKIEAGAVGDLQAVGEAVEETERARKRARKKAKREAKEEARRAKEEKHACVNKGQVEGGVSKGQLEGGVSKGQVKGGMSKEEAKAARRELKRRRAEENRAEKKDSQRQRQSAGEKATPPSGVKEASDAGDGGKRGDALAAAAEHPARGGEKGEVAAAVAEHKVAVPSRSPSKGACRASMASAPGFGGGPSLTHIIGLVESKASSRRASPSPLVHPCSSELMGSGPSSFSLASSIRDKGSMTHADEAQLGGPGGLGAEVLMWHVPALMGKQPPRDPEEIAPSVLPPKSVGTKPLSIRQTSPHEYATQLYRLLQLEVAASIEIELREVTGGVEQLYTHTVRRQPSSCDIEIQPAENSLTKPFGGALVDDVVIVRLEERTRQRCYLALVSKLLPHGCMLLRQHGPTATALGCAVGSRMRVGVLTSLVPALRMQSALRQLASSPVGGLQAHLLADSSIDSTNQNSPIIATPPTVGEQPTLPIPPLLNALGGQPPLSLPRADGNAKWPREFMDALSRAQLNDSQREAVWHCALARCSTRSV
ncbi:MAG: hypothetical protein SGPRY_005743 [Prymnesium sp.]